MLEEESKQQKSPLRRARSPQDKEQKRELILQTASMLFSEGPESLPTAAAIARHSGIAKGTVYLYFKSKEEIFLALLEEYYHAWYKSITVAIEEADPVKENYAGDDIINAMCSYIENHEEFFQLASLSASVIEQNIETVTLISHKSHQSKAVKALARKLSDKLGLENEESCARLLLRSEAMLIGLWQMAHPPAAIKPILDTPSLKVLMPEFSLEARDALSQLWQGCLGTDTNKGNTPSRFWKIGSLFSKES